MVKLLNVKAILLKSTLRMLKKGIYEHYMLKEIHEQPAVMRRIIQEYQDDQGELKIDPEIVKDVKEADRIYIIAAGTSYHAGLVGKEYIEKWAGIPTEVHVSSEFVYNMPLLSENHCLSTFLNQVKLRTAVPY